MIWDESKLPDVSRSVRARGGGKCKPSSGLRVATTNPVLSKFMQ